MNIIDTSFNILPNVLSEAYTREFNAPGLALSDNIDKDQVPVCKYIYIYIYNPSEICH